MSTDDAIELVTKMTIGPTDVIVVRVQQNGDAREAARTIAIRRDEVPRLTDVPFIVAREDHFLIELLDEIEARRVYDVLRKRFEGVK
jgi:hypothetical protein